MQNLLRLDKIEQLVFLYAWACAHNPYPKNKLLLKLKRTISLITKIL